MNPVAGFSLLTHRLRDIGRQLPSWVLWLFLFLFALIALIFIGTPEFTPGRTLLWLIFGSLGSIGGFGVVYELALSHAQLAEIRRAVSAALHHVYPLHLLAHDPRNEAELIVVVSRPDASTGIKDIESVLRLDISKRFWTTRNGSGTVLLSNDESKTPEMWAANAIFLWMFGRSSDWPSHLPALEVIHFAVDGEERSVKPIDGPAAECRYACELGDLDEPKQVRLDVRTFSWRTGPKRRNWEIYLPAAGTVRIRFDGSRAGFTKAWIEGRQRGILQAPFVHGPQGAGTVEAVIVNPSDGEYVTLIATIDGNSDRS